MEGIEYRLSDWTAWDDTGRFDWIIGSDILYVDEYHPQLRRIFEGNRAPGGRILLSDPFRKMSVRLMEALEAEGWSVACSQWDVGEGETLRPMLVFELMPPETG